MKFNSSTIIGVCLLACISGIICSACKPVRQFDQLEQNARKVVTGAELQAWAVNLLAQHTPSNTRLNPSQFGADFPKALLDLAPDIGPSVYVYEKDDKNYPVACVHINWGSGMLGAAGFEVGPTNFVSLQPSHAWQPGVYFYRR